jgi:polar amino acid transport system permease protein
VTTLPANWQVVVDSAPQLLQGLWTTVWISAVSAALAMALALPLAVLLTGTNRAARTAMIAVDVIRSTPFVMVLFLIYYCLPLAGIRIPALACGVFALVLYNVAYYAEILRGQLLAIPRGQFESAQAAGYGSLDLYRRIILPQVLYNGLPALENQTIVLIKNSSFLMMISITELSMAANQIQAIYFNPFEALLTMILLYWALCVVVEGSLQALHRAMARRRSG